MKVRLTEIELVGLIRKMIKEQDDIMANFLSSNNFRNCRGIRLTLHPGEEGSTGMSRKEQRKAQREQNKENRKEWKLFLKTNSISESDLDEEYYLDLKNEMEMYNGMNRGQYDNIFNSESKPFTDDMKQSNVNIIESIIKSNSAWFFYWKDVFGDKRPTTFMDFYNYLKGMGGKKGFDEITNKNYYVSKYLNLLKEKAMEYNENLKKEFPFVKPKSKTNFYLIWFKDGKQGIRYFNNYEELRLSTDVAITEGNVISNEAWNPAGFSGEVSLKNKPIGKATNALFQ